MTEPESTPVVKPEAVTEEPVVTEPEEDTSAEDASDAALRVWAKDNGIEGVPGSGKLSATWRERITTAMGAALDSMAVALDPKEGASVKTTSTESSTSLKMMKEEEPLSGGEKVSPSTEKSEPVVEYHSVWEAPNTFMTSQAFTA